MQGVESAIVCQKNVLLCLCKLIPIFMASRPARMDRCPAGMHGHPAGATVTWVTLLLLDIFLGFSATSMLRTSGQRDLTPLGVLAVFYVLVIFCLTEPLFVIKFCSKVFHRP